MPCFPKMAEASSPDHVCLDPGNFSMERWRLNPLFLNLDGFMTHFDAVWLLRQLLPCLLEFLPWALGVPCKWSTCIESAMLWGSPTGDMKLPGARGPDRTRCSSSPAVATSATLRLLPHDKDRPCTRALSQPVLGSWSIETLRDRKKMNAMFEVTKSVTQQ